jgi:hypothetical protein
MNKLLLLFIILLLGLILCSFLGGNCYSEGFTTDTTTITGVKGNKAAVAVTSDGDVYTASNINGNINTSSSPSTTSYDNYNHYNQTSYPTKYYGPNGTTATIINKDGVYTLVVTETSGTTTIYNVNAPSTSTESTNISKTTFYGQNGGTAKVTTDNNGNYVINVTQPDGTNTIYTVTNTHSTVVPPPQQPTSQTSTYTNGQNYSYYNGANVSTGTVTTPSGNTYGYATGPLGNTAVTSSNSSSVYDSSLPLGIPKSMIPKGQEDLYILKSQVVPPVCPVCPGCGSTSSSSFPSSSSSSSSYSKSTNNSSSEKCPPCPACARCPEPAFDCKKVPNYNSAGSSQYLPMPVLNDFSGFGM